MVATKLGEGGDAAIAFSQQLSSIDFKDQRVAVPLVLAMIPRAKVVGFSIGGEAMYTDTDPWAAAGLICGESSTDGSQESQESQSPTQPKKKQKVGGVPSAVSTGL